MRKRWKVVPRVPSPEWDQLPIPPLLAQVLSNRDVRPQDAEAFLAGSWPYADPFALPDMERAVDILIRAANTKIPTAVYGDFDTDGVTATALLVHALTGLGADVRGYIPDRMDEGYGLHLEALRRLYGQGVRLVVTVDCGIRAVEEIDVARRGLEFIVTDHHSVGPRLPPASAVIDPKREDSRYPFRGLAGVGVAFKLAQALIAEAPRAGIPVHVEERALLDLVALGTVADLAPLLGENRCLVREGLEVLNEARREGIQALLRRARVEAGQITASTVGYGLGPRLNAAGRLENALLSYRLLVTGDSREAQEAAAKLEDLNRRRQEETARAYAHAEQLALAQGADAPMLFAAHRAFHPGIVGLVAGRLTEAYYRPSVVVQMGEGECKGSCRSIEEFHITSALDECRDLLVRHGGHAAAAGFTVRTQHLGELQRRLVDIARRELDGHELAPTLRIDADVPLVEMTSATMEWLQRLEPCGEENPVPLFQSRGVPVCGYTAVGREEQHLKLTFPENTEVRDAIGFGLGDCVKQLDAHLGKRGHKCVDIVYSLAINDWDGESRLQLHLRDVRPAKP